LERILHDAPRSGAPPQFTARQQQQVIALACSDPPDGRVRWTLELLCEHAVKHGFVKSLSKSEVALWLQEHDLKPWRKKRLLGRICGWFLLANGDFRREMRAFPLLEATVFLGAKRRGLIETM
jgi:hypothetical protein